MIIQKMVGKKTLESYINLLKDMLDPRVVESMARYDQIPLNGTTFDEILQSFAGYKVDGLSYLEHLVGIFLEGLTDNTGKYAEYRFANFIAKYISYQLVPKIDFRVKIQGRSGASHEFDVIGFDRRGGISYIAEVKDRKSKITKVDIFKFFDELKDICQAKVSPRTAFYGSSSLFTDDAKYSISSNLDKRGYAKIPACGILKAKFFEYRVEDYYEIDL